MSRTWAFATANSAERRPATALNAGLHRGRVKAVLGLNSRQRESGHRDATTPPEARAAAAARASKPGGKKKARGSRSGAEAGSSDPPPRELSARERLDLANRELEILERDADASCRHAVSERVAERVSTVVSERVSECIAELDAVACG